MHLTPTRHRRMLAAGLLVAAGAAGATVLASGSDHQDTPDVELNPKMDMTDIYAFPESYARPHRAGDGHPSVSHAGSGGRSSPGDPSTPTCSTSSRSTTTGTTSRIASIQVSFSGEGAGQQVQLRGPTPPPVVGAMRTRSPT